MSILRHVIPPVIGISLVIFSVFISGETLGIPVFASTKWHNDQAPQKLDIVSYGNYVSPPAIAPRDSFSSEAPPPPPPPPPPVVKKKSTVQQPKSPKPAAPVNNGIQLTIPVNSKGNRCSSSFIERLNYNEAYAIPVIWSCGGKAVSTSGGLVCFTGSSGVTGLWTTRGITRNDSLTNLNTEIQNNDSINIADGIYLRTSGNGSESSIWFIALSKIASNC